MGAGAPKIQFSVGASADPVTVEAVVKRLRAARYRVSTELDLHQSITDALAGLPFEHEMRLTPGERIDFLIAGRIGLEAKVRCPKRAIYRQLERYASLPSIDSLILITATAIGLPAQICGKPVFLVSLGKATL